MEFLRRRACSPLEFLRPERLICHMRSFDRVEADADPPGTAVITEIGLVMALHLAFALAVVLTLGAYGIA